MTQDINTPKPRTDRNMVADTVRIIRLARVLDQSNSQIISEGRTNIVRAVRSSAEFAFNFYAAKNVHGWAKTIYIGNSLATLVVSVVDINRVAESLLGIRVKRMLQTDSFNSKYARALEYVQKLEVNRIRNGLVYANAHQMVLDTLLRDEPIEQAGTTVPRPTSPDSFWKWHDARVQTYNLIASNKPLGLIVVDVLTSIRDSKMLGVSPLSGQRQSSSLISNEWPIFTH